MRNNLISKTGLILITILAIMGGSSCVIKKEYTLETALDFAGENRSELEKVLYHYKDDPQKLEAAKFLIKNMPHWYAYSGSELDTLQNLIIKELKGEDLSQEKKYWSRFNYHTLVKVSDSKVIKSDFLISNIDLAFQEWKQRPWNKSLTFSDFCELILPYRIGDEPLSDWRKLYHHYYGNLLDSLYRGSDVAIACQIINNELSKQAYHYSIDWNVPHLNGVFLFYNRLGSCRETNDLILYAMRACGIPVAADFMPYSPDYQHSHGWTVLRDTTGRFIQMGFDGLKAKRDSVQSDGRKKGKVYRQCYGIQQSQIKQKEIFGVSFGGENGLYWKDVTADYFGKNSILVPIENREIETAYLSVFSIDGWRPIDIGMIESNNCVRFMNLEPNLIYMPVYYNRNEEFEPIGWPFILCTDNYIQLLKPNINIKEEAVFRRKMPLIPRILKWSYSQIGSFLEGDNDVNFKHPLRICTFNDTLNYTYQVLDSKNHNKFRYVRYCPPEKLLQLAELQLFSDTSMIKKIQMTPIDTMKYIEKTIDGNVLSHIYKKDTIPTLRYDLGKKNSISKILFIPRTDDNYIREGHEYELFYQNGILGWCLLGRKKAVGKSVTFEVPTNALLWLRDKSEGREEQVFIYRNKRQWFAADLDSL